MPRSAFRELKRSAFQINQINLQQARNFFELFLGHSENFGHVDFAPPDPKY